jgi:hypothetical protein
MKKASKQYTPPPKKPDAPIDYGCDLSPAAPHVDQTARTTKPLPPSSAKPGTPGAKSAGANHMIPAGLKAIARAGAGGGDGPSRAVYGSAEGAQMGAMLAGKFPPSR